MDEDRFVISDKLWLKIVPSCLTNRVTQVRPPATIACTRKQFFGMSAQDLLGETSPRGSATGIAFSNDFVDGPKRHYRLGSSEGNGRKRGTQHQAIGRSRGGLTTKIIAQVDALGNLLRFLLLLGQAHNMKGVALLIRDVCFGALLNDKAFDADWLLHKLDERGATAVISPKANRKLQRDYDTHMC